MSRTSSSTEASSNNTPSISPASSSLRVQFDAPSSDIGKRFLQFHVISAGLSEKASGKRPASLFVEMSYGNGKNVYTTSNVNCKSSDPTWHDNLGPMWLKEDITVTFKLKNRAILKATTIASTKAYRIDELVEQQKDLYDLNSTIKLPLNFNSSPPTSPSETKRPKTLHAQPNVRYLTINLRSPSSTESATEEVARAHARRNSIRHEQQQQQHATITTTVLPPPTLQSSDIDSGEDLRLAIDRKAALEIQGETEQIETIAIVPTIICTSPN